MHNKGFKGRSMKSMGDLKSNSTLAYIFVHTWVYALLAGSIGLFAILAMIMYYSRKIDWYGAAKAPDSDDEPEMNTKGYNYMPNEQPEQE
jgi:inner membrane protein involved in colicin E2 resistance